MTKGTTWGKDNKEKIKGMEKEDIHKYCYWCGDNATTTEHVPPKNLFPKEFRDNPITVGSCTTHNNEFSKLDERMRVHMQTMGDQIIAKSELDNKTTRGLLRNESRGLLTDIISNSGDYFGESSQRERLDYVEKYFEKIIRGLYYYHFIKQLNGSTSFFSNKIELIEMSANAHFYYYMLDDKYADKWKEGNSKNKEVFDYKFHFDETTEQFITIMKFYKVHIVHGVTLPPGKHIDDYAVEFEDFEKWRKEKFAKN
jgi:hypothetical protein